MRRRFLWIVIELLLLAAGFRVAVAHWLPNDAPGDGVVYAQMARNVLEQHVYSHEAQPPYSPSLVRLPGYPLFLATVYSIFGHTNNGAVRIIQALIDTATCGLIALLAFYWQPDAQKKRASAIGALALSAICPFTTIYAATILTEVPTNFLVLAMFVATTLALRKTFTTEESQKSKSGSKPAIFWWVVAGLLGGIAVFFRPDNGLFVAAIGLTLVIAGLSRLWRTPAGEGYGLERKRPRLQSAESETSTEQAGTLALQSPVGRFTSSKQVKTTLAQTIVCGALFSIAFALVLVPWTIRNWRVFHVFQPLAPAHAEMPGEFVPRGYGLWLRTWLDDESFIAPLLWSLDTDPIDFEDIPPYAFDSADEKNRVAALIEKYNNPDGDESSPANAPAAPQPSPSPANPKASPSPKTSPPDSDANSKEENSEDTEEEESHGPVEMTPEIDAGFAQIARERIARHRFQFYVWLPIMRARTMWLDTHSQYWPFEGTLLPFDDLDYEAHQQYWLPLFAGLTALYTLLGLAGAWFLWASGRFEAHQWLLLLGLAIVLRLILFSSMENPEPRYLVEFFPLLSILGGIAIGQLKPRKQAD